MKPDDKPAAGQDPDARKSGAPAEAPRDDASKPQDAGIRDFFSQAADMIKDKVTAAPTNLLGALMPNDVLRAVEKGDIEKMTAFHAAGKMKTDNPALLAAAVRAQQEGSVAWLLSHGADASARHNNAAMIEIAVLIRKKNIIDALLNAGANVDAADTRNGATSLHKTIECGQLELARHLIARGANLTIETKAGSTPLMIAIGRSDKDFLTEILNDPRFAHVVNHRTNGDKGVTLLDHAINSAQPAMALHLLSLGVACDTADRKGIRPLHRAALLQRPEIVKALIEKGVDINVPTHDNATPLLLSCMKQNARNAETTALILAAGGTAGSDDGTAHPVTPLMAAIEVNNLPAIEILLKYGHDANACDIDGITLLHTAIDKGHPGIIKALLAFGADPNLPDPRTGDYPLHMALKMPRQPMIVAETVEWLLKAGAWVHAVNADGLSVRALAFHDDIRGQAVAAGMVENAVRSQRRASPLPKRKR